MQEFMELHKPQHAELDAFEAAWGPVAGGYELALERRMQRHDHPESTLSLVFTYTARTERTSTGHAPIASWRDLRDLEGYAAIVGARPVRRRLDQG